MIHYHIGCTENNKPKILPYFVNNNIIEKKILSAYNF